METVGHAVLAAAIMSCAIKIVDLSAVVEDLK